MAASQAEIDGVLARVQERGLRHIQMGIFDAAGRLLSKRYDVRNLEKALTQGTPYIEAAVSAIDPRGNLIGTNLFMDPAKQFRDGLVRMDPTSCRDFPLEADGQGLLLVGQFVDEETRAHCPRALLAREIERFSALGLQPYGGFELESAVLDETAESILHKTPETVCVRPGFDKVYSFVDQARNQELFDGVLELCDAMGVGIDTLHPEFQNMMEAGLRPETGLRIADNAALYKSLAKIVGRRHEALVTFMARRSAKEQGCGAHINLSLRDRDGSGVFFDPEAPDSISTIMRSFIAGLHRYVPDLFLLLAPNFNSYRRFQPDLFTPLNNTWGINNKTVAYRAVNQSPASARVEIRPSGADICPHLALTAVLAAGRRGIEEELQPPEAVVGDGWSARPTGPQFPRSFAAAIAQFERSKVARELLGEPFVDGFVSDRRWQQQLFEQTVTDWELHLFAEGV